MLKKYILLLMVLSFGYGFLVEDVIERYENGYLKKVNYYERIHINGYENQILVTEREFYENGYLKYDKNYKNGNYHGKHVKYYYNGNLEYEKSYKDDYYHGKHVEYYENGQIQCEENYEDHIRVGKYVSYYKNGQIYYEGTVGDKYVEYNRNGQIVYEEDYEGEDREVIKKYIFYHENGQIENEENYEGELLISKSTYDQWGQLVSKTIKAEDDEKVNYKTTDYVLNGPYEQYYKNGKIKFKINYKNGLADGSYVEWFQDGQIAIKGKYCEGYQIGVWTYYDFLEEGGMISWDENYGTCEEAKNKYDEYYWDDYDSDW